MVNLWPFTSKPIQWNHQIVEYGTEKLYSQCAAQAIDRLNLQPSCGHLDSTSLHVDGQYNSHDEEQDGVVHVTQSYSRDHRPDLNQVVLQVICEGQAGIPLRSVGYFTWYFYIPCNL